MKYVFIYYNNGGRKMNIVSLYNDIDELVKFDLDQFTLINSSDDINYYVRNSEKGNAADRKQIKINIGGNLINIDCELVSLIKMLNDKGYNTKYCCSSHFYGEEWYYDKPYEEFNRKATVIYCMINNRPSKGGYILFDNRYKDIEKLIPLRQEGIFDTSCNDGKPLIYTQVVQHRTGIYWWYPTTVDIASKSVKDITDLLSPLLS
jgi:hypothetical protein